MAPKKGKKGRKGKKSKKGKKVKDEIIMTAVDRTFYELTIKDLNNKLARLRSYFAGIEAMSEELTEKMRTMEEDRNDVTALLQQEVEEKTHVITELEESVVKIEKLREEENKVASEKIKAWTLKNKAMYEQLTSEIKLLNGKLNSLIEFRHQRAALLEKFDEQEDEVRELKQQQEKKIQQMQRNALVEKDQLKKEIDVKICQLAEEFNKTSEIRVAGYTRRLMRENIALNTEMDKMVESQLRMQEENDQMKKRTMEIEQLQASSEIMKERLVKTCQNQVKIIANLTDRFENLICKYQKIKRFQKLYQMSTDVQASNQIDQDKMAKRIGCLTQKVDISKRIKEEVCSYLKKNEKEIIRLKCILKKIKFTVQSAIRGEIDDSDDPEFRKMQRQNLLHDLMQILDSSTDEVVTPSPTSDISFDHQDDSLYAPNIKVSCFEELKRDWRKIITEEFEDLKELSSYRGITHKERPMECDTMFDAETGSTLTFSSTTVAEDVAPPEQDQDQEDEGASSSDEVISKDKKAPSRPPPKQAKEMEFEEEHEISKASEEEEEEEETKTIIRSEGVAEESSTYVVEAYEIDEEEEEIFFF